jgi:hypothetical protein
MKKLLCVLTLTLLISAVFAQLRWPASKPVRQGVNIEWSRASQPMDDGSVVYVWSDTRYGDRDLFAQKVDENGNTLWGTNGILVNGEINRQEDPVVIGVGNGAVIVAWIDFRYSDAGDVFAQKLDSNGNRMWAASGVPLCLADDIQISLNIVPNGNGGAYVIWLDSRNPGGTDIYGTNVQSDGTIAAGWAANGNAIVNEAGDQDSHTFWEDGSGGAIVIWKDSRIPENADIYMQRISANGTLLWDEGGNLLTGAANDQEQPKMCPDGTGNFIVTWRDKRNDFFGDIYAQRINLNGNTMWANELQVYTGAGVQRNARVESTSDTGAFIVWEDGRNEIAVESKDLYAQKIDINGNKLWDEAGIPVVMALYDQINPRLSHDLNGGLWIIWEDGRIENHPFGDIYVQHLNSNGVAQLTANGLAICDATGYQFSPLIKYSDGSAFAVWGDQRTGSTGIYVQILDSSGNIQLEQNGEMIWYGLDGDALNFKVVPNGSSPILVWEDTRNASIAIQIYMQIINSNGSFGLIEDGLPITTQTGSNQANIDVHKENDQDVVAVIWEENRSTERKVYAQAVDLNANSLWNNMGIELSADDQEQYNGKISYENGYYYTGWTEYNGDWLNPIVRISGQKLDENGNKQWGDNGIVIADLTNDDVLTDVVERYYVWQNESFQNFDIYVKLVDENGNTAPGWNDNGNLICGAPGNQKDAKAMIIPQGLLVIWKDIRNGDIDIYGQIITPEGNILWEEDGKALVTLANDQELSNFLYNDGIALVWEDFRSGNVYDVYMQKYDTNGNEIFTANGLQVIGTGNDQVSPYLTMNGTGDQYMVFWEDYQAGSESNLMGQLISSAGELVWPANGFMIDNGIKNQNSPIAVSDGNYSYVFWEDTRSSGKTDIYNIYAQKLEYVPVGLEQNEIPSEYHMLKQNFPNPFKTSTAISFNIDFSKLTDAKVNIFNIRGQQIRSIPIDKSSILWDGKDVHGKTVSNGIYFYQLQAKGIDSSVRKMIMLK